MRFICPLSYLVENDSLLNVLLLDSQIDKVVEELVEDELLAKRNNFARFLKQSIDRSKTASLIT